VRPPHRGWAFRLCRACWFRPAREWHHWLWHARWGRDSVWRSWVQRRGPVVALCRVCHRRVTRWDGRPLTPVWLVTGLVILGTWARNLVVVVVVVWAVRHFG
jgi:hypothetical protein